MSKKPKIVVTHGEPELMVPVFVRQIKAPAWDKRTPEEMKKHAFDWSSVKDVRMWSDPEDDPKDILVVPPPK